MLRIRKCPFCGTTTDINVYVRDFGFCGVIIECPDCSGSIRNARCYETIRLDNGNLSTPITEKSLGRCLWDTIKKWNHRNFKANEGEDADYA